jgi:hypothetical protein
LEITMPVEPSARYRHHLLIAASVLALMLAGWLSVFGPA